MNGKIAQKPRLPVQQLVILGMFLSASLKPWKEFRA